MSNGSTVTLRNVGVLVARSPRGQQPSALVSTVSPRRSSLLYLFSNRSGQVGKMGYWWRQFGGSRCTEYDKLNANDQDMRRQAVQDIVTRDVDDGKYDTLWVSAPCGTHTVARFLSIPDWPVLRTFDHVLGIPGLYDL